jgi:hypothetical protein
MCAIIEFSRPAAGLWRFVHTKQTGGQGDKPRNVNLIADASRANG